jgi:hypothetical protein
LDRPADPDDGLLRHRGQLIRLGHDLRQTATIAEDQERYRLEQPASVDPAGHCDLLADLPGQL